MVETMGTVNDALAELARLDPQVARALARLHADTPAAARWYALALARRGFDLWLVARRTDRGCHPRGVQVPVLRVGADGEVHRGPPS